MLKLFIMEKEREIIEVFYTRCLTVNTVTNVGETLDIILAGNFISNGSVESKNKEQLTGQIESFWKLIPDLKWEPQEIINEGSRFVVRSIASGTPNGDFMGLPTNGSKSFKIMTIDIHTFVNERIVSVRHLEDWPTALKQLKQ